MTRVITARQALAALEEVVEHYGEGTIADCVYVQRNEREGTVEPVCIVGYALVQLGVEPEDLVPVSILSYPVSSPRFNDYLQRDAGVRLSDGAALVLRWAQSRQDEREDWGKALADARDKYHDIKDDGREDDETWTIRR